MMDYNEQNRPFFLIDKPESFESYSPSETKIIQAKIDTYDVSLQFWIGATNKPAKLLDIVPLAYSISDKLSLVTVNHFKTNKQHIPCHKGCSLCCNYLVALSIPEVFYLQQQIIQMETKHRTHLLQACCDSAEKILDPKTLKKYRLKQETDILEVSNWYSELGLSCPFLLNGSCRIYEQRPLACREHMVISSSSCKENDNSETEIVSLPVSILEVLGQLSADMEETNIEAVILSLALVCIDEDYIQRSQKTWPAITMVKHFVDLLEIMSSKNIQKSVTSC